MRGLVIIRWVHVYDPKVMLRCLNRTLKTKHRLLGAVESTFAQWNELRDLISPWRFFGELYERNRVIESLIEMLPKPSKVKA